jgi:integrase
MATITLPHLTQRRRVWYARLQVPEALRLLVGKSVLIQTTGHTDPLKAAEVARRIVAGWKRDLDEARGIRREIVAEASPAAQRAQVAGKQAIITKAHIEAWGGRLKASMRPRQAWQYGNDVALWAAGKLPPTDSHKTRKRRLSAIRKFCQDTGRPMPDSKEIMEGIVKAPKGTAQANRRDSFTVARVLALIEMADRRGDGPLRDLIALALYTGARLGELATLKVGQIDLGQGSMRVASKTDAGDRTIPIHKAIRPLVEALMAHHDPEGYLIHTTAENVLGERGMALGKRFGILKTKAGHGPSLVFHSIRKTVATALQDCGCPEPIAADILGHEIATMSYGVYSTGSSLATRREWLEKAIPMP